MRLVANGGGAAFEGLTSKEAVERARTDLYSIFLQVTKYQYADGRIVRDDGVSRAGGIGEYHSEGVYSYDANGQLLEIKNVSSGGEQLRYSYWDEREGLDALGERLAGEMAESVVEALRSAAVDVPVAILQLSYHYADNYRPILCPTSLEEREAVAEEGGSDIWMGLFLNQNHLYDVRLRDIDDTYAQFIQQVNSSEDHDRARKMLQRVAAILTETRLLGRLDVDDEFFAYAIDHSIEGHSSEDFKDILLNCGVSEALYDAWNKRGWMR